MKYNEDKILKEIETYIKGIADPQFQPQRCFVIFDQP